MRIVFMGSAGVGAPSLRALLGSAADRVAAVFCQPDRPKGRHRAMAECCTKTLARTVGIPVSTPADVNAGEGLAALEAAKPDAIVVVGYGQILRRRVLDMPPAGCINLHASLLPKYRGAAPIQWAVANGETVTGVTTMFMNERLDAGDIILQSETAVGPEEDAGTLHDRLAATGAELLARTLDLVRAGHPPRRPQREEDATPAPKLRKEDGEIDWRRDAGSLYNRIRGFHPWPGSYTGLPGPTGGVLKVLKARPEKGRGGTRQAPGTVVEAAGEGPLVETGEGGALRLLVVQAEGGRPMAGRDYLLGHGLREGDVLGVSPGR
jgi:methionyl-tRNA formyltransferase